LSHRIALSKVLTNTFSGEPPSKRFVLVLRALLRHRWALLLAPSRTMGNLGTQIPFPVVVRRTSRNPNVPSTVVQWNSVSSAAFRMNKFGDLKNEPMGPDRRRRPAPSPSGGWIMEKKSSAILMRSFLVGLGTTCNQPCAKRSSCCFVPSQWQARARASLT